MEIYFGDGAPTLAEQGLDLFVDCISYQKTIDRLVGAYDSGDLSLEELEAKLDEIAESISKAVDDVIKGAGKDCTLFFEASNTYH